VTVLPPELLRKGRFDEVFFVDLPKLEERDAILRIHLKRRDLNVDLVDTAKIAELTEGFSGAEVEQALVDAIYRTYSKSIELDTESLIKAVKNTRPLSVLMAEKIQALQHWAEGRAIKV